MFRRFDPFADFDRSFTYHRPGFRVPIDAVRRENEVVVYFDLPGVDADSIDLTVDGNDLSLKAERAWSPAEGEKVLSSERGQGSVSRTLHLGDDLDGSNVEANYHDGVLEVTIPIAEAAKPHRVSVGVGAATPADVEAENS